MSEAVQDEGGGLVEGDILEADVMAFGEVRECDEVGLGAGLEAIVGDPDIATREACEVPQDGADEAIVVEASAGAIVLGPCAGVCP